jgi:hypothetical protein
VEPLIQRLKSSACSVRGSAAYALGLIGSVRAVKSLVEFAASGKDGGFSSITALARIAGNDRFADYRHIVAQVITRLPRYILIRTNVAHDLLRAAFRSADRTVILETVEVVESSFANGPVVCAPHRAAIEYLERGRDGRVLERQQPEMQEAIQILVDGYDRGVRQHEEANIGQRPNS